MKWDLQKTTNIYLRSKIAFFLKLYFFFFGVFILGKQVRHVFFHGAVGFSGSFFNIFVYFFVDRYAFVAFSWQKPTSIVRTLKYDAI